MARADATPTARARAMERHFALSEDRSAKLYMLLRAVRGISKLTHDGDGQTALDNIDLNREDLSCIFEMIGDQLEALTADMPFIAATAAN